MAGIWVALVVGALLGAVAGWRAGRLHMHAGQRYGEWRDTANGLPIVRRLAVGAIWDVVVFGLCVVGILIVAALLVWVSST
jgi:hypothetical protein